MKKISIVFIIISWVFGLTGIELAKKVDQRKTPIDSKVDLTMTLTNKKGKIRTSSLRSIVKNDGQKQIMWFLSPADDKGVAFLKIEHINKYDEMKIWLPAFQKVKRISAKKRSDNFMGSDMSFEDMSSRQLNEYTFVLIENKIYNSISCYILESIPIENIRTEYSRHLTWIHPNLFLPLKEESYDKNGKLLKKKNYNYVQINDYDVLSEINVKNVQKNHSTNLKFKNIELDTGVNDKIFHEIYLKRMPQ